MKYIFLYILLLPLVLVVSWRSRVQKKRLIFEDNFTAERIADHWIIEKNDKDDHATTIVNGQLQLDTEEGITVWYRHQLKSDVLIEYDRTVVINDGKHDRLSDLNQFWMATDPQQSMFTRKGGFREYDSLQMYYVGMGGNYNKTTRMRRYDGKGILKIIGEYSDSMHLLRPNTTYHIQIKVEKGLSTFSVNGNIYFSFKDENPLQNGWFAIRSTRSRQLIDNVKIWQLN